MPPLLYLGVVAIEKGAFESPSTEAANFTLTLQHMGALIYTLSIYILSLAQLCHETSDMEYPVRIELISNGLIIYFNNHYTT